MLPVFFIFCDSIQEDINLCDISVHTRDSSSLSDDF